VVGHSSSHPRRLTTVLAAAGLAGVGAGAWLHFSAVRPAAVVGCVRLRAGPECHFVPGRSLDVWLSEATPPLSARIDRVEVATQTATHATGARIRLDAPRPGRLVITTGSGLQTARHAATLRAFAKPPELSAAELRASALEFEALRRQARSTDGWLGAELRLIAARAARRADDAPAAAALQAEAAELADTEGEWATVVKARFARTFTLVYDLADYEAAATELDGLRSWIDRVPEVAGYHLYYQALLDFEVGDFARAATALRRGDRQTRVLGLDRLRWLIEERRANVDRELGYRGAAIRRLERVRRWAAASGDGCAEGVATFNLGRLRLEQFELEGSGWAQVQRRLEEARRLYPSQCDEPRRLDAVRLTSARAALAARELDRAERWLSEIEASTLLPRHRPEEFELRARLALARGDLPAAQQYARELLSLAAVTIRPDIAFAAHVLHADILERWGKPGAAVKARAQAEATLDALALRIPLVGDRHAFLAARESNVLRLVESYIEERRPGEALDVLRRVRGRSLGWARLSRSLARLSEAERRVWADRVGAYRRGRAQFEAEIGSDWSRARSELVEARSRRAENEAALERLLASALDLLPPVAAEARPPADVLELAWVRLQPGTFVIGRMGDDAFAAPWRESEQTIPADIGRRVDAARAIVLRPYGRVRAHPLHMLKWRGGPLGALRPTTYALDLPAAELPARSRALVVANPEGDLARAALEPDVAQAALQPTHDVVRLEAATSSQVREALARADWFHFGGHGRWSSGDPLASGLSLADGTELSLGDILSLPAAPAVVVLTSCEAGRSLERGGESLGLAHAFVMAGSQFVLAPDRPISDRHALRLARAFYGATGDPAERYRSAVAALGPDATPFRLYVP
jgi:hypothetical protein